MKTGYVLLFLCAACLSLPACSQTTAGAYGQAKPDNQWVPYCKSHSYAHCGYDGIDHHEDGNPN